MGLYFGRYEFLASSTDHNTHTLALIGGDYEIRGLAVGNIAGGTELEVIATTTITNGTSSTFTPPPPL